MSLLFSLLFSVPGLLILWLGLRLHRQGERTLTWLSVSGKLLESDYGPQGGPLESELFIKYQYTVGNRTYRSEHIGYGHSVSLANPVWVFFEARGLGHPEALPVYYDPERPADAVLRVGAGDGARLSILLGAGLALAGAIGGWFIAS
jgi:hypothetical protein